MKNLFLPPPRKVDLKGFTLAEVLITLAIIGVIAAITIPSIVANHQKKALETSLAKTYRTITQMVNMASIEHGSMQSWDWKDGAWSQDEMDGFVKKYFLPHLNVVKFCPSDKSTDGCFADVMHTYVTGLPQGLNFNTMEYPQVSLADGVSMDFHFYENCFTNKGRCMSIHFDVNGHKKPAIVGRDLFNVNFYPQTGEILAYGMSNSNNVYNEETKTITKNSWETIVNNCDGKTKGGWNCSARAIGEGFKINY